MEQHPYSPPQSQISQYDPIRGVHQKTPNKRVAAFFIDFYSIIIPLGLLQEYIPVVMTDLLYYLLVSIIFVFKDIVFFNQSLGKKLVGLKIVGLDGQPATPGKTLLRNSLLIIPFIEIIEYIVMRRSEKEQRMGDFLAKTRVIDLYPARSDSLFLGYAFLALILIPFIWHYLSSQG